MIKAIKVVANDDYSITVDLEDGRIAHLDMNFIKTDSGPVIDPLKQIQVFKKAFIRNGVVCWPSGFDVDPYFLVETAVFIKRKSAS